MSTEPRALFTEKELGELQELILARIDADLDSLETDTVSDPATHLAISKVRVIATILRDFLSDQVKPAAVAPLRAATVTGICNARCVQCPMKYSGEIQDGFLQKDGTRKRFVEYDQLLRTLTQGEDILNFLPLASELLLYPKWRELTLKLRDVGAKIRLSSNAMALREESVKFLIDNAILGTITFSIDASTKAVYERIRVNLEFERVIENIKYFFRYAATAKYALHVGFSFCLMRCNFLDMPGFVDLVASFREEGEKRISVAIGIHSLQCVGPKDYLEFMRQEHHSVIDPVELGNAFVKTQERAEALGIQVFVFNECKINEFNNKYLGTLLTGKNPFSKKNVEQD